MFFFFFFQAEDGIRDGTVTGVQTCALPILIAAGLAPVALVMRKPPAELPAIERGTPGGPFDLTAELERSVTAREAMRDRNFWLIALAFSLTVMGLSAVLLHQIPLLLDLGVDP